VINVVYNTSNLYTPTIFMALKFVRKVNVILTFSLGFLVNLRRRAAVLVGTKRELRARGNEERITRAPYV